MCVAWQSCHVPQLPLPTRLGVCLRGSLELNYCFEVPGAQRNHVETIRPPYVAAAEQNALVCLDGNLHRLVIRLTSVASTGLTLLVSFARSIYQLK
jgi:hypothetical protein